MNRLLIATRLVFFAVATADLILAAALHEWTGVGGWLAAMWFALVETTERLSRSGRNP